MVPEQPYYPRVGTTAVGTTVGVSDDAAGGVKDGVSEGAAECVHAGVSDGVTVGAISEVCRRRSSSPEVVACADGVDVDDRVVDAVAGEEAVDEWLVVEDALGVDSADVQAKAGSERPNHVMTSGRARCHTSTRCPAPG